MKMNYICVGVCHTSVEIIKPQHHSRVIRALYLGVKICRTGRNLFLCLSVSLPLPSCLFGSSEDLGGCTVCHLASETDTKSFGCDLFELMVQNIVSTPTPRGNFIGALGRYKWPMVHLHGQHTHARPTHVHMSARTCSLTHTCARTQSTHKFTPLPIPAIYKSHRGRTGRC